MSKNVLVADDSVVIQKSIGITFAQEGFSITYVGNGEEAYSKAKQVKPDIVIADVVMPKRNGYELCEIMKKDPQFKTVPILLLASAHEAFDEPRSKAIGADGFIIKPFESQALREKVIQLLSRKAGTQTPSQTSPMSGGIASLPTLHFTAPATPGKPVVGTPNLAPKPDSKPMNRPQAPAAASPASTIAGRPPLSQPFSSNVSSPASTIASQQPKTRDTPMLELDFSDPLADTTLQADETSFDFPQTGGFTEPQSTTENSSEGLSTSPANSSLQNQLEEPSGQTLPSTEFWDFSVDTSPPSQEQEPKDFELSKPETKQWGKIVSGTWDPSGNFTPSMKINTSAAETEPIAPIELASHEGPPSSFEESGFDLMDGGSSALPTTIGSTSKGPSDLILEQSLVSEPLIDIENPTVSGPVYSPMDETLPFSEQAASKVSPTIQGPSISLTNEQIEAIVIKVFKNVIERIAWEVVPDLAENIIKEELARLTQEK